MTHGQSSQRDSGAISPVFSRGNSAEAMRDASEAFYRALEEGQLNSPSQLSPKHGNLTRQDLIAGRSSAESLVGKVCKTSPLWRIACFMSDE